MPFFLFVRGERRIPPPRFSHWREKRKEKKRKFSFSSPFDTFHSDKNVWGKKRRKGRVGGGSFFPPSFEIKGNFPTSSFFKDLKRRLWEEEVEAWIIQTGFGATPNPIRTPEEERRNRGRRWERWINSEGLDPLFGSFILLYYFFGKSEFSIRKFLAGGSSGEEKERRRNPPFLNYVDAKEIYLTFTQCKT